MRPLHLVMASLACVVGLTPARTEAQSTAGKVCLRCVADSLGFHGVALIGDRDGVDQMEAFHRDGVPGPQLTTELSFNMGSMTKMFTAVAIGQLIESGQVGYDDPVRSHLPSLPRKYDGVKISHLLQHTAGTGNYLTPANIGAITRHRTTGDLMALAIDDRLAFVPGTAYRYSNSGYVLLGAVIEAVSGMSYQAYVRRRILDVAGMRGTAFRASGTSATNYSRGGMTGEPSSAYRRSEMNDVPGMPAGGAYTTATDMYRFGVALLDHRLVNAGTLALLTTPTSDLTTIRTQSGRTDIRYAHGFSADGKYGTFGHGGGAPGVNAEFRVQPATGRIAVTLTNVDPPMASTMMVGMLQAMTTQR